MGNNSARRNAEKHRGALSVSLRFLLAGHLPLRNFSLASYVLVEIWVIKENTNFSLWLLNLPSKLGMLCIF